MVDDVATADVIHPQVVRYGIDQEVARTKRVDHDTASDIFQPDVAGTHAANLYIAVHGFGDEIARANRVDVYFTDVVGDDVAGADARCETAANVPDMQIAGADMAVEVLDTDDIGIA